LSQDGGPFRLVPVPKTMHLMSVEFESPGSLVAVGSHELFVRATRAGGRIAYTSPAVEEWLAQYERIAPLQHDRESGLLMGTVRDERGDAIAGALVKKHGDHHGEGYKEADTDAKGGFLLGSEHGEFTLSIEKAG